MTLRIVHLSDFHLNKKTKRDWDNFLKSALEKKLKSLNTEKKIDTIAFTGDLIDQAGKELKGAHNGFEVFDKEVIIPILESANIKSEEFFIIPGNHDVVRSNDELRDEYGSRKYFEELKNISDFVSSRIENSDDFSGMQRIKEFKDFESRFYESSCLNKNITKFGSSFIFEKDKIKIGIACLDSAWRCYDNDDKGRLIISELQLAMHTRFLDGCKFRVALIHHPLDHLTEIEQSTITSHLFADFNLILVGHKHKSDSFMKSGFTGRTFINMAPSGLNDIHSDSREYSNGFSVVDVDLKTNEICVTYWRYNHNKKEFVLNTDLGVESTGKFCEEPIKLSKKKSENIKDLIDNIIEDHYDQMDQHIIWMSSGRSGTAKITIEKAFVLPPIQDQNVSNEEKQEDETFNIDDIIQSPWDHQLFFGGSESGKTVLLFRLLKQYVSEFHIIQKVPVYIDFEDLGNTSIKSKIKEYLRCNTAQADILVNTNSLVLLIDNLNYKKYKQNREHFKRLHGWIKDNPKVKIIATSDIEFSGVTPMEYIDYCEVPFKNYFINYLRAKEIKSLIKVWLPSEDDFQQETRLDKMINDFNSYALPSSAMSVSLFLWSTENTERKPINSAVLLEIYIEIILEKISKHNIYRESFDFKNKLQLLAKIAQEMYLLNEDNYSIAFSQYVSIIEDYLKNLVGFDFDSELISQYFIDTKIFKKYQKNRIKFTYSCFFHFFLAKRMEFDSDFAMFVIQEDQYFKFYKELDYYSGLTRSDKNLLLIVLDRFEEAFKQTDFIINEMANKWDNHFLLNAPNKIDQKEEFVPQARTINITKIKENRPSKELIEDFHNRRLSNISNPSKILRKDEKDRANLEVLLIIMANILRNSEGVEDKELKKRAYSSLIKYSMTWMVLYREYLIEYVLKNKKLPPTIPLELSLKGVLTNLPLSIQMGMSKHVGTPKLNSIILEKIKEDTLNKSVTGSDIEAFLSVATYADLEGKDFHRYFKAFIKRSKNTPVRDYTLHKLINQYYLKTKPESRKEQLYLDLLIELKIKSQKLPLRMRDQIKKNIQDAKKKYLD